jgi:hypothetical protein
VLLIMEWVNAALLEDPDQSSPSRNSDVPTLVVSQAVDDDFAPGGSTPKHLQGGGGKATLTLSSKTKMSRAQFSHMDLATFSERFGTLTIGKRGGDGGFRMLREESGLDLANELGDDDSF